MFTFALADSSPTVPFVIDANSGVISVSGTLDYEMTQQYSFMVGAQLCVEVETLERLITRCCSVYIIWW